MTFSSFTTIESKSCTNIMFGSVGSSVYLSMVISISCEGMGLYYIYNFFSKFKSPVERG